MQRKKDLFHIFKQLNSEIKVEQFENDFYICHLRIKLKNN